jgi:predicted nucleic acid-binding protein
MNAYIIDATVLAAYLIADPATPHSVALMNAAAGGLHELLAPEFAPHECVNVLWKQVRFHGMPLDQAEALVDDLLALPITLVDVSGLHRRALQIGAIHRLAVYDSIYLALSERLHLPLVTPDSAQSHAAVALDVLIKPLSDFTI